MAQEVATTIVSVGGKRIEVHEAGAGPPILYLHGAGSARWMPALDRLAVRHRVVYPVHPGFGDSEGLGEIETIEDLVFHTVDVMDALGLDGPDVVGHSLGGWLAAELALRHPARVRRLVLVDADGVRLPGVPMGEIFMATPAQARALLFHDPDSETARAAVPDVPSPAELPAILRAREAEARLLWNPYTHYRKLTSRLGRIKTPTLVVWGESDRLLPLAYGEAYARGIPGARLVTLARCGHVAPREQPERFAEVVEGFLA